MANEKISQFTPLTTLASGDYLPIIDISEPAAADQNKRVGIDILDGRYYAAASGDAALTLAVSAQASGNAALVDAAVASVALASGNAALVDAAVASVALASGNAALVDAATAQASGNAALTDLSGKYDKTGGPISGPVTVQSQSIGTISTSTVSGVIFLDFGSGNNFDITLNDANNTLAAPTSASGGQTGQIVIRQDGGGSRLLSYSGGWQFTGGSAPTLSTAAGSTDALTYYCASSSGFLAILTANFQGV